MSSLEVTTSSHTGSSVKEGDIDGIGPCGQCDLLDTDAEDATLTAVALPSTSPTILAPCVGPRRQFVADTTTYFNDTEMDDRDTLVDTAEPMAVAYDGVAASNSEVTSSSILQIVGVSLVAEPRGVVDLTRGDTSLGNRLATDEDASGGNNSEGRFSDLKEGARVVGFRLNIAPNTTNSSSLSRASDHGFDDEDQSDKQLQILHLRPLDLQPPISGTQSVLLALPERSFQRGFGSVSNSQTATVKKLPYLPQVSEIQLRQHLQRQQLLEQQLQLQRIQQQQQRHQLHQQLGKHVHLYEKHYQVDQLQLHANHQQLDQQVQLREKLEQLDQRPQLHHKHQQPDQHVPLHHKHQQPDQHVQSHHKHQQPDQHVQSHHKHQQPDQHVQSHHKHQQPDQHVQSHHKHQQPDQRMQLHHKHQQPEQHVHFHERLQQPDQPVKLHQTQQQQQRQLRTKRGKQEQQKQGELQRQKHDHNVHKQQQQHQQEEAVVCRLCCAPPGGFLKNLHSKLKPGRGGLAVIEELVETKNASLPPAVQYHSHKTSRTEKRSRSSRGSRSRRQRLVTSDAPNENDNELPIAICDIEISLARSNSCNATTEQTIGDFHREIKDDEAQRAVINCFRDAVRKTVNCLLRIFWLMLYYLAIWLAIALFTFILFRFALLLTSDGSRYPYYMGPHSCCLHGAQITFRPGWKSDGAAEYNADVRSQRRAVIEQLQAAAQVEEQAGGKGQTRDCASLEDEDGSRKLRPEEMHEMQLLKPCGGAADFAARARSFLSRIPSRPVLLVQLLRRIGYLPARPGGVRIACRSEPPMPLVHASLSESGVGRELDINATYGRVPSGFFPALSGRHWLPPVLVALPYEPDIWGVQRVRLLCQSTDGGDGQDGPERMIVLSLRRT